MSGLLKLLGVYQGRAASTTDLYENDLLIAMNDVFLVSLGCSWAHLRQDITFVDMPDEFPPRIRSLLKAEFQGREKTVSLKDPRISLLLDSYIKAFWQIETPLYIVRMDRPADEVYASLESRGNSHDHNLYEKYNIRLDFLLEKHKPKYIEIEYDYLLRKPAAAMKWIEIEFGLDLGVDENLKEIVEFVDPERKHH
jgi:hypothetical protein